MKRTVSFLLCLALVLSLFAGLPQPKVSAVSTNQQNIVDRANYLYNITWVCQKTVSAWCGQTYFYQGSTYHIPYGQPINSGYYVGYGVSIEDFVAATKNANSVFYNYQSSYGSTYSTYYATDCSAFVSWCWGIERNTTYGIPNKSTYLGMATAANASLLQVGDCLNSNSAGHVVLVTGLSGSGSSLQIEITEQTPPQIKRSYYSASSLGAKYGSQYGIYRYSGTVPASPGNEFATDPVIFNAAYYKAHNSDLSSYSDADARSHWVNYGLKEGRCASPVFDVKWYLNNNGDLKSAYGTDYAAAARHFLNNGVKEGRRASAGFNFTVYKANYDDLVAAYGSDNYKYYLHYINNGANEQRVADRRILKVGGVYSFAAAGDNSLSLALSGTGTVLNTTADTTAQQFVLERNGGDALFFKLRPAGQSLYLGMADGSVKLGTYADNDNYKWNIITNDDGTVTISNRGNGKCFDVTNGSLTENNTVQVYTDNGTTAQRWKPTLKPTLSDGVYSLVSLANDTFAVDISGIGMDNTANAHIWENVGGENQKFAVYHDKDGFYAIRALHSDKCVEVTNAATAAGSNVAQYTENGTPAQQWAAVPNADGSWVFVNRCSGKALDINGGTMENGTNVQIWNVNGTVAQSWKLIPVTTSRVDPQGDLMLVSAVDSSFVAEIVNDDLKLGAKEKMPNEVFRFTDLDNGYYSIASLSGKLLGVADGTVKLSAAATPGKAERWQLMPNADGTVGILNAVNGYYLNLRGGKAVAGADVFPYHYNGDAASRWNLEVNPHTHSFTDVVTPPTCTEKGYTTHSCADCGGVLVDSYVEPTGHRETVVITPATCVALGYKTYTCSVCGNSRVEYMEAEWSEWSTEKPPVQEDMLRSRTVYRYKDYVTTTSTAASMEGYDQLSSEWQQKSTGSVSYASFPNGFNTGSSMYTKYHNNPVSNSETATAKTVVNSTSTAGYIYWHWCHNSADGPYWRRIGYQNGLNVNGTAVTTFHVWESDKAATAISGGDTEGSYDWANNYPLVSFCNPGANWDALHNNSASKDYCKDSVCWIATPITKQTYTTFEKVFTYGKYTDWSDWSETPVEATDSRQVESRVEYSYIINDVSGDHTYDQGTPAPAATCTEGGVMLYTCTSCGATKTETVAALGHSFRNGSCVRCGVSDGSKPADLVFAATTIGLEDKIIYTALTSKANDAHYDQVYVTFTNLDACDDRMSNMGTDYGTSYSARYTMYQFPIYVCQMTDRIAATVYGLKDGKLYEGQTAVQTVEQFVLAIIGTMDTAKQNMSANLLEYGAMMQKYFKYRTDHLANDELGIYESRVLHSVPTAENTFSTTSYGRDEATFYTRALSIGSVVQIQYVFKLNGLTADDIYVEITVDGLTTRYQCDDLIPAGKYTALIYEGLLPTQADSDITITVYDAFTGLPVSEVITDTLTSAVSVYQSASNESLRNAVNAMLNYYRLAATAFGK